MSVIETPIMTAMALSESKRNTFADLRIRFIPSFCWQCRAHRRRRQRARSGAQGHELVSKRPVGERAERDAALDELARRTSAVIVQRIGHVGVFYRRGEGLAKVLLPDH